MATASTHSPSDSDGTSSSNRSNVSPLHRQKCQPRWNYRLLSLKFFEFQSAGKRCYTFFGTRWRQIESIRTRYFQDLGRNGKVSKFFNPRAKDTMFSRWKNTKDFYFLKIHRPGGKRMLTCITRRAIICDETTLFSPSSLPFQLDSRIYP